MAAINESLSIEELSRRTGEPLDRLSDWRRLKLIGVQGDESYGFDDVERIRLVQQALRRGFTLEQVVRSNSEQNLLEHYLGHVFPNGVPPSYLLSDIAEDTGVELAFLKRVWQAAGLSDQGETVYEEDRQMLLTLKVVLNSGLPEEALLQTLRVMSDSLSRVAETLVRMVHFYIHDRLRSSGMDELKIGESVDASINQLQPVVDPALLYFHGKGLARAARDDFMLHLAEESGMRPEPQAPAELPCAIVFVDLSSFTPLTANMGDAAAALILERFSDLVRDAVNRWEGKVVKQIGDAFMLVFSEPRSAVACALEVDRRALSEAQFPAVRSGAHWGPVLFREGDYIGTTVNVASRVAAEAGRHEVLVTSAVRKEAGLLQEVEFIPLGKRQLKGLSDDVELYSAQPNLALDSAKLTDPVCEIELQTSEVAAKLSLGGRELAFCSEECLSRFTSAPDRYRS